MDNKLQQPMNSDLNSTELAIWTVKFQENMSFRRGTMFRFLAQTATLLTIGNAGGVGFIFGVFPVTQGSTLMHWMLLLNSIIFMLGVITAVVTLILLTLLTINEAHAAETGLNNFVNNKMTWQEVVCYNEKQAFKTAPLAAQFGIISSGLAITGTAMALVMLAVYY